MKLFEDNTTIRVAAILISFSVGMILILAGWKKTGELAGLVEMLIGVGGLLIALAIYNYPYRDKK